VRYRAALRPDEGFSDVPGSPTPASSVGVNRCALDDALDAVQGFSPLGERLECHLVSFSHATAGNLSGMDIHPARKAPICRNGACDAG
jgi:hypothetical protein